MPVASRYCDMASGGWIGSKLFSSKEIDNSDIQEKTRMKDLI
jgi:hypothetical protein